MQLAKLQKDMMEAMKAHDKARKESISVLYSAAKKLGIDNGCRDNVPEEMVDQAILKEVKSVKEQIETCPAERTELLEEYKARLAVFEEYAPKMLSADEVEVANDSGKKLKLLEGIYLLVGWFHEYGAVAIDEKAGFHKIED